MLMSALCRLCVQIIMSLSICFKKLHLINVGAFAWYSVKIRVIFDVQFERRKVNKSKPTWKLKPTCKLDSRVFWIFLPNVIKIDPYNFKLYRFKVGAFFLRHSVVCTLNNLYQNGATNSQQHVYNSTRRPSIGSTRRVAISTEPHRYCLLRP